MPLRGQSPILHNPWIHLVFHPFSPCVWLLKTSGRADSGVQQVQVQVFRVRSWVGQLSPWQSFVGRTVSAATVWPRCRSEKAAIDNNAQADECGCAPINLGYGHGNLNFTKLSPIPEYYCSFDPPPPPPAAALVKNQSKNGVYTILTHRLYRSDLACGL